MSTPLTTTLRIARTATGGIPVAPHVAGRLAAFARGDERIIREIAAALTPAQLRGGSVLPDPLPMVPSARSTVPDGLRTAERRTLLFAALGPDVLLTELLEAAAVEIDVLLFGELTGIIHVEAGRARFLDERIRTQILHESSLAERRSVHAAIARAARRRGNLPAAAAHAVAADPHRLAELEIPMMRRAEAMLAAGDPVFAARLARRAAEQGGGGASRAWTIAGIAALWAGAFDDALEGLHRAARLDPGSSLLQDLIRTHELLDSGPSGSLYSEEETAHVFRTLESVARNPADRALMGRLGTVYVAAYRNAGDSDDLHARTLLSSAAIDDPRWSPHAAAHLTVSQLTALVFAGELDAAARMIAETAPRLPLIHPGGGIVTDYVRACLGRAPGVDGELARAYEAIAPAHQLRYDPALASDLFPARATARAVAATVMAAPAPLPVPSYAAPVPEQPLSARQLDVLALILQGLPNRAIGERLGVSHRTVEVHATQLMRKYGVTSRSALIALHAANGR